MRIKLIIILTFIISESCFAVTNTCVKYKFGRIDLQIITFSMSYSEIEKTAILGKYCCDYLDRFDSQDTFEIFIKYYHNPLRKENNSDYFLGNNKGLEIDHLFKPEKRIEHIKNNGLTLIIISSQLNIIDVIKIIDYGIKNYGKIKEIQKSFLWENRMEWQTISIDLIHSILREQGDNTRINNVISQSLKFESDSSLIAYSFRNDSYCFYNKNMSDDIVRLNVRNLYQIFDIDSTTAFIFDTDSSFYYLSTYSRSIPPKIILKNKPEYYGNYAVIRDDNIFYISKSDEIGINIIAFNSDLNKIDEKNYIPEPIYNRLYDLMNPRLRRFERSLIKD